MLYEYIDESEIDDMFENRDRNRDFLELSKSLYNPIKKESDKLYKTPIVRDYHGLMRLSCDDYRMQDIGFGR